MVSAFAARRRLALDKVKVSEKSNEVVAMEIEGYGESRDGAFNIALDFINVS